MELTQFQKSFNEVRAYFNGQKKAEFRTIAEVAPVDTSDINVVVLATVTLMLIHNSEASNPPRLNIDTLPTYDLSNFTDWAMFDRYIDYIIIKKNRSAKKQEDERTRAGYGAVMVRYLWIAQLRQVSVIR